MKTVLRWGLFLLLPALLIVEPALAYDYPLSSEAIREAYFLGSGDPNKRFDFFAKYTKTYPIPKSGQYVGSIEFETPYVVIAERVSQSVPNYFAQDAEKEYLGKPVVCRVRVEVYYGWPAGQFGRFQSNYTVRLKQQDKEIPVKSRWSEAILSNVSAPADVGVQLTNEYDADNIDSSSSANVEVLTPDGNTLVETFDLGSFR
jgi:hypothetical protein